MQPLAVAGPPEPEPITPFAIGFEEPVPIVPFVEGVFPDCVGALRTFVPPPPVAPGEPMLFIVSSPLRFAAGFPFGTHPTLDHASKGSR